MRLRGCGDKKKHEGDGRREIENKTKRPRNIAGNFLWLICE